MERRNSVPLQQQLAATRHPLLAECAAALEELQADLEQQLRVNAEQDHLIRILQQAKDYYEHEHKHNSFHAHAQQLAADNARLAAQAHAHRQDAHQLTLRIAELEATTAQLQEQLRRKEEEIEQGQRVIAQIQNEKQLLEVEWTKVVRAVKRKIAALSQHPNHNKENLMPVRSKKESEAEAIGVVGRAQRMLAELEREEAIEELEGLFLASQSSNGKALRENSQMGVIFNSMRK